MPWCRIYSLWASPSPRKRFSRCFASIATTKSRHWIIYWTSRHKTPHSRNLKVVVAHNSKATKTHKVSKLTMTCIWLSWRVWKLNLCLWTRDKGKRIFLLAWKTSETHATSTRSSKPFSLCRTWLRSSSIAKSELGDKAAKTTRRRLSEYS